MDQAQKHLADWLSHPSEDGRAPAALDTVLTLETPWPFWREPFEVSLIRITPHAGRMRLGVSSASHAEMAFAFSNTSISDPDRDWTVLPPEQLLLAYAGARAAAGWLAESELETLDPKVFDAMLVKPGPGERHTKAFRFVEETILCLRWTDREGVEMENCGSLERDDAAAMPLASAYHAIPFEYFYFGRRWAEAWGPSHPLLAAPRL